MNPLTVGVLGCGHIAPRHVHAWRHDPRFELRGVFDLDVRAARSLVSDTSAGLVFDSSDQLIAECDVVDVCTPPATHFGLIESALAEHKHVVVEKPVVVAEDEWWRLKSLLEGHRQSFSVVHHMKFTRLIGTAKSWIERGRLGRLVRIESYFASHPAVDRMLGGEHHWSHTLPGGRWFETLPHNLYLVHHLAGPLAVRHVAARRTATAPVGVHADEVSVSLRGAQTLGGIHFSANCRHNYRWTTLVGSEGVMHLDLLSGAFAFDRIRDRRGTRAAGRLFLHSLASLARAPVDRGLHLLDRIASRTPHARFVAALGDHLFGTAPAPTSFEEIAYTIENTYAICNAIEEQASSA